MPDNTPSQLQAILKKMHTSVIVKMGDKVISTQKAMSIDQAEQAILALFMECLPEKISFGSIADNIPANYSRHDNTDTRKGFNKAIDITAQNMQALTSQLEQEQK